MSKLNQSANNEAIFGIAPMLGRERTHGFWAIAAVTGIYALAPWCFTQGSYIISVLGLKLALTNIIGIIVLFSIIYLLIVIIPTREGIDTWIYQRATFGQKGILILWFIVMLATWGWEAILAKIYGTSLSNIITLATGAQVSDKMVPLLAATCVIIGAVIACMGPKIITWVSYIAVPGVIVVCSVILYIVFSNYSWAELMALKAAGSTGSTWKDYMLATEWNLAFVCAWYAVVGVIPRLGKSERGTYWGFLLGFGLVYALIACVGAFGSIAITDMTGEYSADPANWLANTNKTVAILSLALLAFSNISIMAVAMYSLSVSTKVINPVWKYTKIVIAWSAWTLFLVFGGFIWNYYNIFLAIIGFIGGPTVMIIIVDYFLVRKQKISLKGMYSREKGSSYYYTKGINYVGFIALICGAVSYFLVYDPILAAGRNVVFNFTTGTGLSCLVAATVYFLLAQIPAVRNYLLKDRHIKGGKDISR